MIEQFIFEFFAAIGTIAFAVSGAFKGIRHRLDVLGVLVLAFVTAIGGGLVRDALLHRTPAVFIDIWPALFALVGCLLALLSNMLSKERILSWTNPESRTFLILDAIGLAAFTVTGAKLGAVSGLNIFGIILLAAITGVGGGVIRDMLVGEIPLVLNADFYATATLIGGFVFGVLYMYNFATPWPSILSFIVTLSLRLLAIWRGWKLPVL
ncbi:hypothetical protein CUJ83_08680 [Methanocella sp. CWC-04]|uniref:Glycine transporter domain-containing protein n=2 Tax=Methanooceanicella nereidis TaxID=2052831 RepID=A0AAP2RE21_9EURY|nr:hypothetical protein [Methanocella sp. CWC-04]